MPTYSLAPFGTGQAYTLAMLESQTRRYLLGQSVAVGLN